ncbi:MAG: hypothetical protein NTZ55_00835 [Candidatus Roizmanbacteria bacterium]|nr:hypothetical protein [Candidatus Roizmanbacteria bacterium]
MSEYVIPKIFQKKQPSPTPFARFRASMNSGVDIWTEKAQAKEKQENELIAILTDHSFKYNEADAFAVQTLYGKVRFPAIIPPQMTRNVVEQVGYLDNERGLRAFYIAMCSSLYYEARVGQITKTQATKFANTIHDLFVGRISPFPSSIPTEKWIDREYAEEIKKYSELHPEEEFPQELANIIEFPLTAKEEFGHFFNRNWPQKKS